KLSTPQTGRTMVTGGASGGAASGARGGRQRKIATATVARWRNVAMGQNASAAEMRIIIPSKLFNRNDSGMKWHLPFVNHIRSPGRRKMSSNRNTDQPQARHDREMTATRSTKTRLPRRDG